MQRGSQALRLGPPDSPDVVQVFRDLCRLLSSLVKLDNPDHVTSILGMVWPWTRALPANDQLELAAEVGRVAEMSESLGTYRPLLDVIADWRRTARLWADGWSYLCAQQPGNIATLYDRLAKDPRQIDNRDRQGPLKGDLGRATVDGEVLEQWQYEIAGGGRVWYAVHDNDRVVWITKAAARHPNETK